jgi:folylpolyglutamate synthase/dihydropteroate synthase
MGRKDLDGVVAALTPTVDDWHLIDWGQDDEAYPAEDVAECVRRHGGRVAGIASLEGLLDGLMRRADRSGRVVAFGSFRVAEGVLRWQSQVREAGDGRRSGVTCPPGGAWE